MYDLPKIFKAAVIPIMTIEAFAGVVFMIATAQEADMVLWGVVVAGLGKMGIEFGIGKVKK